MSEEPGPVAWRTSGSAVADGTISAKAVRAPARCFPARIAREVKASAPRGRRFARRDELFLAREVLRRDVLEEVLELLHDLLGVLDLVLELDRRLGDDVLGGEDRRARPDGQGEGVGGPRVDLDLPPV